MRSLLASEHWKNNKLVFDIYDAHLSSLEDEAGLIHDEVEKANMCLAKSKYVLKTFISGSKKKNKYKLSIRAYYYEDKSKHKHENNSHRQKISI